MIEQFANNYESTLNGAINNLVTTLVVTSATGAPSSGQFRLRIDSEIMLVTGISGTTLTVTRGVESTSAASHLDSTPVALVLTKGALEQKRIDDVGVGTLASLPTVGATGRLYIPTDTPVICRDSGSVWEKFGPIFLLSPVPSSGWSWANQSTATVTTTTLGQLVEAHTTTISGIACRHRNLLNPSGSWQVVVGLMVSPTWYYSAGHILIKESSGGKMISYAYGMNNNANTLVITRYSSETSFSSLIVDPKPVTGTLIWFKITYDGTSLKFYMSHDKIYWTLVITEAKATFLGVNPDQIGIGVDLTASVDGVTTTSIGMHLVSWDET